MGDIEADKGVEVRNGIAIAILLDLNSCNTFFQDPENPTQIICEFSNPRREKPQRSHYAIDDFFLAVDYYQENRASEAHVREAMTSPWGTIDVYSPFNPSDTERAIVVKMKNYLAVEMLEFAYLLARGRSTVLQEQSPNLNAQAS